MDNQPSFANQQLLATLVDRYLHDNKFSKTHTSFRNEASFIFSSPMIHDKLLVNSLSLDKMMDDLIWLNNEKVMMLNERGRTQKLLQSMKLVMNSFYNSVNGKLPQTKLPEPPFPPLQPNSNTAVLPTGVNTFTTTPAGLLVPKSINTNARTGNVSTHMMVDQERFIIERERYQTRLLLFRMRYLINNYNSIESLPITNISMQPNANSSVVPQPKIGNRNPTDTITLPVPETNLPEPPLPQLQPNANCVVLPTGVTTVTNPPAKLLVPQCINSDATTGIVSTHVMSVSNRKRKDTKAMDAPSIGKKSRGKPCSRKILVQDHNALPQSNNAVTKQIVSQSSSATQSLAGNFVPSGSQLQESNSSVKCLLNPPPVSVPIHSPVPKKPTRTTSCQFDASVIEASDDLEAIISSIGNHLGTKFSFSDDDDLRVDDALVMFDGVLNDPDLPTGGVDFSDHPTSNHLKDNPSRSSHECKGEQVISELPSTVGRVLSEKDVNIQGPDSLTPMKSFKKSTTNLSSRRNRQLSFGKENCCSDRLKEESS